MELGGIYLRLLLVIRDVQNLRMVFDLWKLAVSDWHGLLELNLKYSLFFCR